MTDPLPKLEAHNISKVFSRPGRRDAQHTVFDSLSFSIYPQQFVSIIGPSGCGKTTLLYMLAGLSSPSQGELTLDGETVRGPSSERGVVFQQDAIFMWRTVQRNVEYGMEMNRVPRQQRKARAREYLKLVGLDSFADFLPKELSGGMKKRVAIATVLANRPQVLLMDEPFSALDYPSRFRLQSELLEIWDDQKITTVFVTHDIEEALFLSDRILVLADGRVANDLTVPFARPRDDSLRTSADMQEYKRHLWEYL